MKYYLYITKSVLVGTAITICEECLRENDFYKEDFIEILTTNNNEAKCDFCER